MKIFKETIFLFIIINLFKSTFDDVDRAAGILNLASPTHHPTYYEGRYGNTILPLADNKFIVVYIGNGGKC